MKHVVLEAKNLKLSYPGQDGSAISDISFVLEKGEACGLIGPNGAGKTSLLSVFTTLLKPDAGCLQVLGTDALRAPRTILPRIGFVPQDLALYERLTGFENLSFFGQMQGMNRNRLAGRVEELLDFFGVGENLHKQVATYSGGMKRRLNLIIGLLHKPDILFLDEPTVGIDTQSRHHILRRLQMLNRDGMTMIYTSHYLEEVQQLCKRVAIIDGGRIIAEGHPQQLCGSGDGDLSLTEHFLKITGDGLRE